MSSARDSNGSIIMAHSRKKKCHGMFVLWLRASGERSCFSQRILKVTLFDYENKRRELMLKIKNVSYKR